MLGIKWVDFILVGAPLLYFKLNETIWFGEWTDNKFDDEKKFLIILGYKGVFNNNSTKIQEKLSSILYSIIKLQYSLLYSSSPINLADNLKKQYIFDKLSNLLPMQQLRNRR